MIVRTWGRLRSPRRSALARAIRASLSTSGSRVGAASRRAVNWRLKGIGSAAAPPTRARAQKPMSRHRAAPGTPRFAKTGPLLIPVRPASTRVGYQAPRRLERIAPALYQEPGAGRRWSWKLLFRPRQPHSWPNQLATALICAGRGCTSAPLARIRQTAYAGEIRSFLESHAARTAPVRSIPARQ